MSKSFTVSCTICWVTFSLTIDRESLLGGRSGQQLVEGNANSVPGMVMLFSSEVNLVSSACNLFVIKALIFNISVSLSLNICTTGLKPFSLEQTLYIPHRIYAKQGVNIIPPTNNNMATVLECMWRGFLISTNLLFSSLNLRVGRAANQSGRFSISLLVNFSIPKSSISEYLVRFWYLVLDC